ncbi:MAG TPA: hypothetical protein VEV45_14240 [Streptosporangiaceae bacterium]|nr:hypothetical protein [Streptosporangiaceae bacterium]
MIIDVITALVTTIAIAAALSLAMFGAATLAGRGKTPARIAIPAGHPDQPADARELVLR